MIVCAPGEPFPDAHCSSRRSSSELLWQTNHSRTRFLLLSLWWGEVGWAAEENEEEEGHELLQDGSGGDDGGDAASDLFAGRCQREKSHPAQEAALRCAWRVVLTAALVVVGAWWLW